MAREPAELQEIAWKLIDESVTKGTMTLIDQPGKPIRLSPQDIVRIAQWLATSKAKKPQVVPVPEDYILKHSTSKKEIGDKDEAED